MSEVLIIIIIYLIAKLSLDILQIQTIKTVPIDQQSIDLLGINSNEEYKSRRYNIEKLKISCLLYTSPSPRDATLSRMPSSA